MNKQTPIVDTIKIISCRNDMTFPDDMPHNKRQALFLHEQRRQRRKDPAWAHRFCQHVYKSDGEPCKMYKATNSEKYCRRHSAMYERNNFHRKNRVKFYHNKTVGINQDSDDMAKKLFFSQRLGPKLQAVIAERLEEPETEQFKLFEHLALINESAVPMIECYQAALDIPVKGTKADDDRRTATICRAAELMRSALMEVIDATKKAKEIDNESKDKISISSVGDIVAQINRLVYEAFGHDTEGLLKYDNLLDTQLRLPTSGAEGTSITPDLDVGEMDATIPYVDEPIEDETTPQDGTTSDG